MNKATILNKFLNLIIEKLLDELHGAQCFSKVDFRYHLIHMHKFDIQKTDFCTQNEHYSDAFLIN